ncbi:hypothetical protein FDECE_10837 [Fusarium decemcellulare]|nr:hypothetical protein FDECE_10837 [Fusarium decemcellulare]
MPAWTCFGGLCDRQSKALETHQERKTEVINQSDSGKTAIAAGNRLASIALSSSFSTGHDRDYQVVQWQRGIQRHFSRLSARHRRVLLELCNNDDLPSSIAYLDGEYKHQGLAIGIKTLEPTLTSIDSFSHALSCLAQAGPESIQLLWGSILLLVKITLRHTDVLDKITQMLDHLAKAMPRFKSYLDLYPTTQLRRAMRAIYDDFVEFCLSSADFLSRGVIENVFRLSWSAVDKDFDKIIQALQNHTIDFEAEAQLANTKATKQWQEDILQRLSKNSSHSSYSSDGSVTHLVSTLPFPRNLMFTGREDILQDISRILQLPQADQSAILRSVTLYGMGGVGKTQIALEYAYRFRGAYSHMFWVKCETEVELRQSFTSVAKGLGLQQGGENEQRDVDSARKWLETSESRWLLVFDNVQHVSVLRRYWPRGARGNAIITSQRPSFDEFTNEKLQIRSLTVEEGRSLILRQMHLEGGDESIHAKAEELCEELGGSPLAIAHYTGFCVASHMSLTELVRTFQQRSMSAEIWSCNSNASVMQYERTLSTVWDASLSSLAGDARDLLNIVAFLNPDCIPEELLQRKPGHDSDESAGYDPFKLTVMLSSLTRRNLVERNIITPGSSLRMHRSLRLALMLQMDTDVEKRQEMFKRALHLTRQAFPRRDMTSRSPQNDPIWKKNMPQVLGLQSAFERSDPPITSDMEFASLLSDAGSFLWEQQLNRLAVPILLLGERIVLDLVHDDEPSPVLASLETTLSTLEAHESAENREVVMTRQKRVINRRERILNSLPPGTATIEQQVDLGRAWNDLAYFHADIEEFEEAERLMMKSLALYNTLGDETTLRFRFALQYADLAVVRLGQGRVDEALELGRKSFQLCKDELGHEHIETVRFESIWAYTLIASNNLNDAMEKLTDVLNVRSQLLEKNNPDILTTKYWIGTVHFYQDCLEEAEQYLRQAIEFSGHSGLGQPDLARARYRLALVLYEQRRLKEAVMFEDEAINSISEKDRPPCEQKDDILRLLDRRVYIQNGRSTGAFRGIRSGRE